jgi:hypothetical protein
MCGDVSNPEDHASGHVSPSPVLQSFASTVAQHPIATTASAATASSAVKLA